MTRLSSRLKRWFNRLTGKDIFELEVVEEEIKLIQVYHMWDKRHNTAWLNFEEEKFVGMGLAFNSKLTQTLAIKMAKCYKEHMEKWK